MIAAQKGHGEMVRILLREGKCKKDQIDAVNDGLQYVYMLELVLCVGLCYLCVGCQVCGVLYCMYACYYNIKEEDKSKFPAETF